MKWEMDMNGRFGEENENWGRIWELETNMRIGHDSENWIQIRIGHDYENWRIIKGIGYECEN